MRAVLRVFRYLSYFFFIVVGIALAIIGLEELFGLCPGFSANTGISCGGAWYEGIVNMAMGLVLYSLLMVVPAVLAIAGLIFFIISIFRRRA